MRGRFFPVWTPSGILWYLPLMLHADRIDQAAYRLPPPRLVEGTGGRIYTMVLATPGVMEYPEHGFAKYTPAEVLQDQAWLDSMAGIPIVDDDQAAHAEGVDTTTIEGESIGRILRAWWDPVMSAVLAEGVIDVERGLRLVDSGVRGVSPAYTPDLADEVGEHEGRRYTRRETRRSAGNNVAVTRRPRGPDARLQADAQGEYMNPFLVALTAFVADFRKGHADAEGGKDPVAWAFDQLMRTSMDACGRADAAEKALADMKAKADAGPVGEEVEDEATEEVAMEDAADAIRIADSLNVPVKGKLADLRRAVAVKLEIPGADKLAADALPGVITAFRAGQGSRRSAADRALDEYHPPKPGAADSARSFDDELNALEIGVHA